MFPRLLSIALACLLFAVPALSQGANGLSFQRISVALTTDSITRNQASINFDVTNSLSTPTTIKRIAASFGVLGLLPTVSFNHSFSNFIVPAQGTVNSGTIQNASFNLGLLSIVQIILLPAMDIVSCEVTLGMQQFGIPTNFTLNLT